MEVLVTANDLKVDRRFTRFGRRATNMTEAFVEITASISETNKRTWARGVKLADSTIAQKEAAGETDPLVRTGHLKASLTEVGPGEFGIREIHPTWMRFGTTVFYARFQQRGTKTMKKHRVLKFTITTKRLVHRLLAMHLHR